MERRCFLCGQIATTENMLYVAVWRKDEVKAEYYFCENCSRTSYLHERMLCFVRGFLLGAFQVLCEQLEFGKEDAYAVAQELTKQKYPPDVFPAAYKKKTKEKQRRKRKK